MGRNFRVRMKHERAVELLREWVEEKRPVSLGIVFGLEFHTTFPNGILAQIGESHLFYHEAPGGALNQVSPHSFKSCEREDSGNIERLIFESEKGANRMILTVSKDSKPIPLQTLSESKWVN
jgi:hypothetical protein